MKLLIFSQKMIFCFFIGFYYFLIDTVSCSSSLITGPSTILRSEKDKSLGNNSRAQESKDNRKFVRFSLTKSQNFFNEFGVKHNLYDEWLESIEVYVRNLNKFTEPLTGIIPTDNFEDLEELIKIQERMCKFIIAKCFSKISYNLTESEQILSRYEYLLKNLNEFIELFDQVQYRWDKIINEIKGAFLSKSAKIEQVLRNTLITEIYLNNLLKRKKKQFKLCCLTDIRAEIEFNNLMKNYQFRFLYDNFEKYEYMSTINYLSSFSISFKNKIEELRFIEEKIIVYNPESINLVQEDLLKIFMLFDSNGKEAIINSVKKVKEINVYLYEELKIFENRYSNFLHKLENFIPRFTSSGQNYFFTIK